MFEYLLCTILVLIWMFFGFLNIVFYFLASDTMKIRTTKIDIIMESIIFFLFGPIGSYALVAHEINILRSKVKELSCLK
jgi:hypothetical protein